MPFSLSARKRSFPPVISATTRLLLLGSLPGEQSLARGQYYANPRNQFWRLIGEVTGNDLESLHYAERLDALLRSDVGLWDVVRSATRAGSLDGAIRAHVPNALPTLVASLPRLRAVGFNGAAAARIGLKALGPVAGLALVPLPSSSPAYTLSFERKREAWMRLRDFL